MDTIRTLIGIICKYRKRSEYAVKWKMSYQKAMMYFKTIPAYNSKQIGKGTTAVKDKGIEVNSFEEFMKLNNE